ncbi:MAG: ice-binding family protein [bacterium]|nr:ice-binding family protein [bacterium]
MKKTNKVFIVILGIALFVGIVGHTRSATLVNLNTARGFAVLAGAAISDTGVSSTINGNVGLSPTGGTGITVLSCTDVIGTIYDTNDGYTGGHDANVDCLITNATVLTNAKADVSVAYNDAKGQATTSAVTASATDSFAGTGYTLTPGVYTSDSSMGVPASLTLDGGGDPNAVFIFQAGSTLTTVAGSTIVLTGGAKASNVFWQVGSSATLGTGSTFEGTIMAAVSITDSGGSTINGRLFADADNTDADSTGAVTLNNTAVSPPATLNIIKTVVNDSGGTAVASDFSLHVKLNGTDVAGSPASGTGTPGTAYSLAAGTYVLSEDSFAAYTATISGDCATNGSITLLAGETKTCTITNDDIAPQLIVNKIVINDNGGTNIISDFPLFVDGSSVTSGVATTTTIGVHTVSETSDAGYTTTIGGNCAANGTITLALGDVETCTITNDDSAPVVVEPSLSSVGPSGFTSAPLPVPPLITVLKVPSPLSLPDGPATVEYTYTLRNIGTIPVADITMVGDSCSPLTLISGDVDRDNQLDVDETWIYTCNTTLTETHTNVVTATGWANGISATDIANATVVVGLPIVPPLIHVTKVPSSLLLPSGGGKITYTNIVTNPGTVALSNVSLADDKCSPVGYVSGDTNGNAKLDITESWTYTCSMNLTKTTVNTVSARGDANGLTARDFAIATVVVSTVPGLPETSVVPKLPNTGLPSGEEGGSWNILALLGILAILTYRSSTKTNQTI